MRGPGEWIRRAVFRRLRKLLTTFQTSFANCGRRKANRPNRRQPWPHQNTKISSGEGKSSRSLKILPSDAAHQQKDDQNQDNQAQTTTRIVTPTSAVRPRRKGPQEQNDQDNKQYQRHSLSSLTLRNVPPKVGHTLLRVQLNAHSKTWGVCQCS